MVIDNEKAVEILTGIINYCDANGGGCRECFLGLRACDKLFGQESVLCERVIDLSVDKTENKLIIGREKAIVILTNYKKICIGRHCESCLLGRDVCDSLLGKEFPSEWEINLKAPENITEKEGVVDMKFKVFDKNPKPEVFFKLEQCYDTVKLVACDREGNKLFIDGDILSIQKDGTLRIFHDVNPALGLQLDEDGRIILDND